MICIIICTGKFQNIAKVYVEINQCGVSIIVFQREVIYQTKNENE